MCAAVSAFLRAAMRAGRRSAIGNDRKSFHQTAQRELVTVGSKAADYRNRGVGQRRPPTLWLTSVDVGQVYFDERDFDAGQRVANGEAGMAVCARVYQRAVGTTAQRVHRLDDLAFAIVLRKAEIDAQLFSDGQEVRLDVGQRLRSVKLWLTRAEEVEIWPIDDGDSHSPVSPSSQAR